MIDIKFAEIFSILGVGILVTITLVYFFFLAQKLFNIRRHNKNPFFVWLKEILKNNYRDSGYAIVSAILVYSTGVLTQDLTDHMTDSENNLNPIISFVKNVNLLNNEGELRKASLVENNTKLTGLGREVFKNTREILHIDSAKTIKFFNDPTQVPGYWEEHGTGIMDTADLKNAFMDLIGGIYYTSKNWCYLKAEPIRKELDAIQERIDFSRSVCIVSFFGLMGIILIYLAYYVYEQFKKKSSRFKIITVFRINDIVRRREIHKKVFYPTRSVLILLLLIYISRICYSAAEKNFNERAMGYYVSHLKIEKTESRR
ncbi:MAG: hypothetical protein WBO39_16585 [Ferruginibacter sp.]